MKLFYIADTRLPTEMAHGLQIMKTCEAFSKLKVQNQKLKVELVVPRRFSISKIAKQNPFDYYRVGKTFKIKKVFCFDLTPLNRFLGPISYLIQALSFSFFASIYLLFRKTDLIYSRDRFSLFFVCLFKPACRQGREKIIFEMHKTHKSLCRFLLKRIKKIVAITNELKNYLIQRGISKDKILVAPDGIDLDDFVIIESKAECREKLSLPQDKKLIVYTGQLFKWKGVETLALTSKFLDNNYLIVIVGGIKWYLTDFKHFIEKNNLKNVLCLGHRNYAEIPYFLKAADCLVLTGTQGSEVSRKYTSPLKMFEYMASQTPIIASELSSVKEILNSNNCIFVEPNNAELMANAIKKIIGDIELSENISAQAYKDVQKYTWGIRAKKILVFIKN